jgi:hypothetical protein
MRRIVGITKASKNRSGWEYRAAGDDLNHPIVQATGSAPAADGNARFGRRDRRELQADDLTDKEAALIAKAVVPAEHARLDEEIKDRRL